MERRVLEAAADWVFVPPDAEDFIGPDYRLTLYADRASVQWSATERPLEEVIAEVRARGAVRPVVRWWVDGRTTPLNTAEVLRQHGFEEVEVVEILARDLANIDRMDLGVPEDVEVRPALDAESIYRAAEVDSEVFGWPGPPREHLDAEAQKIADGDRSSLRFVVEVDGEIAGSAGYTLAGDVVRLWGGCVLEKARGRGAYRALLASRCQAGAAAGATLALVKGRTTTSAPILRQAGFTAYGTQHCYQA
ncbi:GNAT family N-acetyltransferase [Kribbella antiqua]|uniref:GNAT family N-acetyltransferase n=1 Tax=Kribbella antiqua TaxID=2512217 RepID=UPI001049FF44|nr:GNAT family N-acetyltransferase [Kribbella antiqua]